jgi:formylmethanofuran dehydrogenase subunit E
MGLLAADLLKLELPQADKRLYTFIETDGCFADGVAVATGCWLGHRTMRLMDHGKTAATFVDTFTERAFRIWPNPEARQRAEQSVPDAQSRWHAMVEAYQWMPVDELLCAAPVTLTLNLKALISHPGVRVTCDQCGEEIINEREVFAGGKVLCRSCAGENYWSALALTGEQT